ncbi:MAG: AIR synthase-related protein [Bacteroidia bacterium]|nr:AIR synthase-related protein [Bacteroidia bacterium]
MSGSYLSRGVDPEKADVHQALRGISKGLYTDTFCKLLPDLLAGDPAYATILHADTAGTKAALAYLYWRETGDTTVWRGIVQDALVMNFDDMACSGALGPFAVSATLGRNRRLVPGEVVVELIGAAEAFFEHMRTWGIEVQSAGGETADVGDLVRTLDVGYTVATRLKRSAVQHIQLTPGMVCVGIASFGQARYEPSYTSGIGSNGLTFARHELLHQYYRAQYPETYDPGLEEQVVYQGPYRVTDPSPVPNQTVGQLLLSPTRTYLPFLKALFGLGLPLGGIVHCTGGGQTKVVHFIPQRSVTVLKDNLPPPPPVFDLLGSTGASPRELYQVFNMGVRLEVYLQPEAAPGVIGCANQLGLEAWVTGRVAAYDGNARLHLTDPVRGEVYSYS